MEATDIQRDRCRLRTEPRQGFSKYIKALIAHREELKKQIAKAIAVFVEQACIRTMVMSRTT